MVSEQACALIADVQAVFCAGAWAAVIIMAMAVIDASLRETEFPHFRGSTKKLVDEISNIPGLHNLRKRRNALVHVDRDKPALTVDQQWVDREKLEMEASEAVRLMFETFYIGPCV